MDPGIPMDVDTAMVLMSSSASEAMDIDMASMDVDQSSSDVMEVDI